VLADLTRRFGRIDVALAAWNAGEGTVRKHGGEMPPSRDASTRAARSRTLLGLAANNLQRGARQLHTSKRPAAP